MGRHRQGGAPGRIQSSKLGAAPLEKGAPQLPRRAPQRSRAITARWTGPPTPAGRAAERPGDSHGASGGPGHSSCCKPRHAEAGAGGGSDPRAPGSRRPLPARRSAPCTSQTLRPVEQPGPRPPGPGEPQSSPGSGQSPVLRLLRFGLWGRTCRLSRRDVNRSPEPHTKVVEAAAVTAGSCHMAPLLRGDSEDKRPVRKIRGHSLRVLPAGGPHGPAGGPEGPTINTVHTPPHPWGQGREAPQPPWPQ